MRQYLEFDTPEGKGIIDLDKIVAIVEAKAKNPAVHCMIYTTSAPDDHYNCTEYYPEVRDRLADIAVSGNKLEAELALGKTLSE